MNADAGEDKTPSQTAAGGNGVLEDAHALLHGLRQLTHDRFRLAALETRQAGESLVVMVAAGVLLAILLGGAWLGLLAAFVLMLVENGFSASIALVLAFVCNGLAVVLLCVLIRHHSRHLQFPATVRSLHPSTPSQETEQP